MTASLDLEALRTGDQDALRGLVEQHQSVLLRLAMTYTPNRAIAEEAVQETWLAALRGLHGFEGRASLRTWLVRILLNTARRRAGIETRTVPFSGLPPSRPEEESAVDPARFFREGPNAGHWTSIPDDWTHVPETRLLSDETQQVVNRAVDRLPASQREVITLRDLEGWSAAEVTQALGITDGNQRVLLHRARAKVRKALEDYLSTTTTDPLDGTADATPFAN